jgi:hypothetical protein
MKTIQTKFNAVIDNIITTFEKKHDLELDYHIDNEVFFFSGDYYTFNLCDITYDLFNDLPKDMIIEWLDYNVMWSSIDPSHYINLKSWHKGCPRRTEEQYEQMLQLHNSIEKAKEEFKQAIEELNNKLKKQ